jgi:hypothetical protein
MRLPQVTSGTGVLSIIARKELVVNRRAILTGLAMLFATASYATTIASWDMLGEPGDQPFTSGVGSPNVNANDMVRGSGLIPNAGDNSLNSRGWASISPDDYVEFGFSVGSGFFVTLDELIIATRSSNTGPGTLGIFTSFDGFASPIATLIQPGDDFLDSVIDLSALGPVMGNFSVRLLEIGNTQADGVGTTADGGTFRVVDFLDSSGAFVDTQFTGTLQVPDPPTLYLLAFGLVAVVFQRRR